MHRLVHHCTCWLAFGIWLPGAMAQDADLDSLKSRQARNAVSSYQRKVESATKDYEKAVSKERDKLINELEDTLKKETANGNLDEALKLKSAIESLKKQSGINDLAGNSPQMVGTWKLQFSDGVMRYQQFLLRNGQPYALRFRELGGELNDEGPVVLRDGKAYIRYKNWAITERFTLDGDRLIVEHWNVGTDASLDRFPTLMGLGTRVESKEE